MEAYNNPVSENNTNNNDTSTTRGSLLYARGPLVLAPDSPVYGRNHSFNRHQHQQSGECFLSEASPIMKLESREGVGGGGGGGGGHHHRHHQQEEGQQEGKNGNPSEAEAIKAKIIAHPQYSNLLEAYMECQKVGAPPEVVARLTAVHREFETRHRSSLICRDSSTDPELDQFMEAYYNMLVKYREELMRPIQEAMEFMRMVEAQLSTLGHGSLRNFSSDKVKQ